MTSKAKLTSCDECNSKYKLIIYDGAGRISFAILLPDLEIDTDVLKSVTIIGDTCVDI